MWLLQWMMMYAVVAEWVYTLCCIFVLPTCVLITSAKTVSNRKLCVEYQVESSRATDGILTVIHGNTPSKCIIHCTRNPLCMAFNTWHDQGTCELLPDLGDCGESRIQEGSTFTHLKSCNAESPWSVHGLNLSTNLSCFNWTLHSKTVSCPINAIRSPHGGHVCLALTPHKGLYLPSWHGSPNGFRFVKVDKRTKWCPRGYLLQGSPNCSVSWALYKVGEPIPVNAIQVSTWTNESPLYFVASNVRNNVYYIGYYSAQAEMSYIMFGNVWNPNEVFILVCIWQPKTNETQKIAWHFNCHSIFNLIKSLDRFLLWLWPNTHSFESQVYDRLCGV